MALPPKRGSSILPIIGCSENNSSADNRLTATSSRNISRRRPGAGSPPPRLGTGDAEIAARADVLRLQHQGRLELLDRRLQLPLAGQ